MVIKLFYNFIVVWAVGLVSEAREAHTHTHNHADKQKAANKIVKYVASLILRV